MPSNPNNSPVTVLISLSESAKPISEEDQKRWAEEWANNCLDKILYLAIGNKDIARTLCEKATLIAANNNELTDLIKKNLNKGRGRPKKWSPEINKILLIHYAYEMLEPDSNHEKGREQSRIYNSRASKILLCDGSIENKITDAINDVREGRISLSDFPDWAQPIIQTRMDKGAKTMKRTKS